MDRRKYERLYSMFLRDRICLVEYEDRVLKIHMINSRCYIRRNINVILKRVSKHTLRNKKIKHVIYSYLNEEGYEQINNKIGNTDELLMYTGLANKEIFVYDIHSSKDGCDYKINGGWIKV